MLFLALVVVPATRGLPPGERASLFGAVGRQFRTVRLGLYRHPGGDRRGGNVAFRGVSWDMLFSAQFSEKSVRHNIGAEAWGRGAHARLDYLPRFCHRAARRPARGCRAGG